MTLALPLLRPLLPTLAAIGLLLVPAAADARSSKGPAPKLTIDERICNRGDTEQDRYAVITATALLRSSADRAALRFAVQEKNRRGKWVKVLDIGGTLGEWESSASGRDGLRFTKTINGLAEGTDYRISVQARGLDADGKAVTSTSRRYVRCKQPQITPHATIVRALAGDDDKIKPSLLPFKTGPNDLVIELRNTGRSDTGKITLTLRDASTGELFAEISGSALAPKKLTRVVTTRPTCDDEIEITVRDDDRDPEEVQRDDQVVTIDCAPSGSGARRR